MMNIGILTYHRSVSYGAFLQTFALCRYLRAQGHSVSVIDYTPEHRSGKILEWSYRFCGLNPQNLISLLKWRWFNDYTQRFLPLTRTRYRSLDELQQNPPRIAAVICGSDQIWNPNHTGGTFDPAYFAAFGGPDLKRIAYAPSMGMRTLPPEHQSAFRQLLERLDRISAREPSTCRLVSHYTGKPCPHVLDPTFLETDYTDLCKPDPMIRTPYVLVYGLQESTLFKSVLEYVREHVGIPLVFVGSHYKIWRYNGPCRFCTPGEWINLYRHAHAVVTSSFHGTVFSLLFNKPFVCVALSGRWQEKNVRMRELLEALHAPERFVESPADIGSLCTTPPLPVVSPHLERLRQASMDFLNTSLTLSQT